MRDLQIVFMGTPDFAVATLKSLVDANINVVGVITAPDRPAGRGRKLHQSAVKEYAVANNLPILQPTNLKSESFLEELKKLNANLQIVVAFRMLPKVVWQMPEFGTFNLHASLLPQYRGAAPIHWAIVNGAHETGLTTFFIDEKIDTGEIIFQKKTTITATETVGQLHDRLMKLGAMLVLETVEAIKANTVTTYKQPESVLYSPAPKLHAENTKIDWSLPMLDIYNKVRGLNPYPVAWCNLLQDDEKLAVKIYAVKILKEEHTIKTGTLLISKSEIKVAVKEGYIIIEELKIPGKRKMDSKSLLNGFTFSENAKML